MKKNINIILSWLLPIIIIPQIVSGVNNFRYVPSEIIVKFKSESLKNTKSPNSLLKNTIHTQTILPLFQLKLNSVLLEHDVGLDRIFKLKIPDSSSDIFKFINELSRNSNVEYCHVNHIYDIDYQPNDPFVSEQWIIDKIGISSVWDIERGSKQVLIAIIDTGIDYNHEDLTENIWINPGEDVNNNGQVDSSDFNHIDDDHNGFIDDIQGWDFTDAPNFPDGGDYLVRDNDPMDEHGHGTSIAGIVGAVTDNKIGIAGLAPGCTMMNLRAGTSQGLLEEEDVASAIVYAVDNGARVINLSFGDVVASPLLHDVMKFAYYHNCILVASAGNSSSDEIHYPSGFTETISVGASTKDDLLAGFSNYGTTIDLVAPGESIFSTGLKNQYGDFSGTSTSAPIISAIAGLILSHQPHLSNEIVKNILITSADDLGTKGRDNIYGAGRVNANKALQVQFTSEAEIFSPELDAGFYEPPIIIRGTASGALLDHFKLYFGTGDNPDEWHEFVHISTRQVIEDTLGLWDFTHLPDTSYTIRLQVNNKDGSSVEDLTRIFIDRTPPEISNINTKNMFDGRSPCVLIDFETDDLCQASIFYRPLNSTQAFEEIKLHYITKSHRFNFTNAGTYEFFLSVTNISKLHHQTGVLPDYLLDLTHPEIPVDEFVEKELNLPSGYMLSHITDLDEDGLREIIINEFDQTGAYNKLKIYEFDGQFKEVYASDFLAIPRDIGDSDQDGLREILAGSGSVSFLLESPAKGEYPTAIVWTDSNDFWASRISDLNNNGQYEIIGRRGDSYAILEAFGDNQYSQIATITNPTPGSNATGIPRSEIGDFDGDGFMEILIGDADGDIYIYETSTDNQFISTWWQRQPLIDCINYISAGDYDGDGIPDFAVGCHSSPDLDSEHEYDARYWIFRIYKSNGDNSYAVVWEQAFYGYESIHTSSNGISSGDIDNDHHDELLINIFPDFYIIDFDASKNVFYPQWYFYPNQTQLNAIGDINGDGLTEFFLNNGKQLISFDKNNIVSSILAPPFGFQAYPLDTNQVQLKWQPVTDAESYTIFRGRTDKELDEYDTTIQTEFIDVNVNKNMTYWYAIAASNINSTSRLTSPISVIPGFRPYILNAIYTYPHQVRLTFSEPMNSSVKEVIRYFLNNQIHPRSVIITKSYQEVLLTFEPGALSEGMNQIMVQHVYDQHNTPIDTLKNIVSFYMEKEVAAPYLLNAEMMSPSEIKLQFNQQLEPSSATTIENYHVEPSIQVLKVTLHSEDSSIVVLHLDTATPIGALGKNYVITVRNVQNIFGIQIQRGKGDQVALVFYKENLSNIYPFPNPFKSGEGTEYITFANLTQQAHIKIMTATGEVIREINETDGNGGVEWDLKDRHGNLVSSGIYIYYVQQGNETRMGKLAILR